MTKILITGATGNTGAQIARGLIERGHSVRVGVRDPKKAAALAGLGAEVVRYDYDAPETLAPAFAGVERVYLLTPFAPGFERLGALAIEAARGAGVRYALRISAVGADPRSDFWPARGHGLVEKQLAESGLDYTILQPTFFMDNLFSFHAHTLRGEGTFYGAAADGRVSYVSSGDIAEVAVALLSRPEGHSGKTYVLTGEEALSEAEVAALASRVLERKLSYTNLSAEAFAAAARENGVPEPFVQAMTGFEGVKANGWGASISPAVRELLGRAPETYEQFLRRNRDRL